MIKVTYSIEDSVAVIAMDDGKANAFDFEMFAELNEAIDQAQADDAKLVVFKGRQGLFCGGLNLKIMPGLSMEQLLELVTQFGQTMCRVFLLDIPTVAAIEGHAIAGGMQLALACDRRFVMDVDIRLQMNEMLTGMILPSWMCNICKKVVPAEYVHELWLHAHVYSPAEALEKKIINAVVPQGQSILEAIKFACQDMMSVDKGAYGYSKKLTLATGLEEDLAKLPAELARK